MSNGVASEDSDWMIEHAKEQGRLEERDDIIAFGEKWTGEFSAFLDAIECGEHRK